MTKILNKILSVTSLVSILLFQLFTLSFSSLSVSAQEAVVTPSVTTETTDPVIVTGDNFSENTFSFSEMFTTDLAGVVAATTNFANSPLVLSASVDEYSQCANDDGDGYATGDIDCRWTNGNLNASNSTYSEGDATVQRLAIKDLTSGDHTVTIQYDSLKGGKHAYDFLTDDNFSELASNTLTDSDLCDPSVSNFASCATTNPGGNISGVIPTAPNAGGFDVAAGNNRRFKIRNGSWSNTGTIVPGIVSAPTVVAGADEPTNIQLKFNVDTTTCANKYQVQGTDVCEVLLTWGTHISTEADWGDGNSAVNIPGSPYHIRVIELDGSNVGNRDNQMQASAINVPQQATLTLVKTVTNDDGGSALPTDWTLSASGLTTISGVTGDVAVTNALVDAGTYTLSESVGPLGYTASTYSCVVNGGVPVVSNSVNLAPEDSAICTINNDDQAAHLIVIKQVNNGNTGATYTSSDFTMTINGVTASGGNSFPGEEPTGTHKTLTTVGSYSVTEAGPSGYSASESADCEGTIALGETKTCTITNTAIAPQLRLVKTVINDNGGTKQVSDFVLSVDGNSVTSGEFNLMTLGLHTASEIGLAGYSPSDWGADCAADGSVSLALGESKTCEITNDDMAPSLTLVKEVINDHGGTAQPADFTLTATGATGFSGVGPSVSNGESFDAGTYTLSESVMEGYTGSNWVCTGDGVQSGNQITLDLGESASCKIVNDDQPGTLIIKKIVINDNGGTLQADDFTFEVNDGDAEFFEADGQNDKTVNAGTYSVIEPAVRGYAATYENCSDLVIPNGGSATCTITNNDIAPTLTIIKDAQPNDLADFTFARNFGANFQLDDDSGVFGATDTLLNSVTFANLTPGSYSVNEILPNSYWKFESVTCVDSGSNTPFTQVNSTNGVTVDLALADAVTCTFVNTKPSPTRTLGFWQTHTSYTSGIFTNNLLNNMPIGVAPHKGSITTTGQLFGAFFASISKTSTGARRSAIDQARMQLLQQLVAAKLNCAAFGCEASVQTLIGQADAAYAGSDKNAILASASLLDAFNNSGDTIIVNGTPGKATPLVSKTQANLKFWDTP